MFFGAETSLENDSKSENPDCCLLLHNVDLSFVSESFSTKLSSAEFFACQATHSQFVDCKVNTGVLSPLDTDLTKVFDSSACSLCWVV